MRNKNSKKRNVPNLICGTSESRTRDLLLAKQALYHLSYGPKHKAV